MHIISYGLKNKPVNDYIQSPESWGERSYLRLDAVQTSEPEDLASPQLHLGVVDLVGTLRQLLLVDLLLGDAVAGLLQELQVVRRDGGHQLWVRKKTLLGGLGRSTQVVVEIWWLNSVVKIVHYQAMIQEQKECLLIK